LQFQLMVGPKKRRNAGMKSQHSTSQSKQTKNTKKEEKNKERKRLHSCADIWLYNESSSYSSVTQEFFECREPQRQKEWAHAFFYLSAIAIESK
jgi:hypothetical protein